MNLAVTWYDRLPQAVVEAVERVLDGVRKQDGVSALSEHAHLHMRTGGDEYLVATDGGRVIGYAQVSHGEQPVVELLVSPEARGRGLGSRLLHEVRQRSGDRVRIWAHGSLPAAAELARRNHLVEVRRLCQYARALRDLPSDSGELRIRGFTDADADDWLALNAAAFADLPDQGSWTRRDLDRRRAQEWFDPDGFLLAFDDEGLAGCHWTKVHGGEVGDHERIGEVYVLAVAPRAQGRGLGAALTVAGLRHLRDQGLDHVMLYVDSANRSAVTMYERLGFQMATCDVQYAFSTDEGAVSGRVEV